MSKTVIDCMNSDSLSVEIVFDGPSLPICQINIDYSKRTRAYVFLGKEHLEKFIIELQSKLKEM